MSERHKAKHCPCPYLRRYHIWTLIDLVCDCQDTNKNICDSATTNTTDNAAFRARAQTLYKLQCR